MRHRTFLGAGEALCPERPRGLEALTLVYVEYCDAGMPLAVAGLAAIAHFGLELEDDDLLALALVLDGAWR